MNDPEERRRELVKQTRQLYDDTWIPAVRIRGMEICIKNCIPMKTVETPEGSFAFRLALGILLFVCYVWIDRAQIPVMNVDSSQIAVQIEKQMNVEKNYRKRGKICNKKIKKKINNSTKQI